MARTKRERRQLGENIELIMDIREREIRADLKSYSKSSKNGEALKPSNRRLLTAEDVNKMYMPEEVKPKKRHQI
jgi:hypothetical protein